MKHAIALAIALALIPAARAAADSAATKEEQGVVLIEQFAAIVDANKDDCARMGDKLTEFLDSNSARIKKLKADKAAKPPTQQELEAFEEKYDERLKAAYYKMMPGLKKCQRHAKVTAAQKNFSAP